MRNKLSLCALAIAGALVVGCDSKSDTTPPAAPAVPAVPTTPATPQATPAMPAIPAAPAAPAAPTMTPPAAETPAAPANGAVATADQQAAAQKAIADALQYIKDNKYDLADKALASVDSYKASLPQSLQDQLANAHKMLDGAKASGGIKIPGMGN